MTPTVTPPSSLPTTPQSATVALRGHHLLCLLGYRGMGYSADYVANMTRLYEQLRLHPETQVAIVAGPDELCAAFPCDQPNHCAEATVHTRDRVILDALSLAVGQCVPWQEIEARVRMHIVGSDLVTFCQSCPWRPYGVCEAGIDYIGSGKSLPELPPPGDRGTLT